MTPDELAHYGVLGMKWGKTRAQATSSQIRQARRNIEGTWTAYTVAQYQQRHTAKGTKQRAAIDKKVEKIHQDFLKDPDRAVAVRMTAGEKAVAVLFAGPSFGGTLLPVIASSAASRRIEQKQDNKDYDKKK